MKRSAWMVVVAAVVGLAGTGQATAQEHRFELGGGTAYPLVSQRYHIDNGLGWRLRANVRITPRFALGAVYERQRTDSAVANALPGKVETRLYGLSAFLDFARQGSVGLYGVAGAGRGELTFANPAGAAPEGFVNDTDVRLWYEAGAGVDFTLGGRWAARLQVTARQTEPDGRSLILDGKRFSWVPSLDVVYRF